MKRRTKARMPLTPKPQTRDPVPTASSTHSSEASDALAAAPDSNGKSAERRWKVDQAEGLPVPVIRANMIALRISYQGRVQVAFFDHE